MRKIAAVFSLVCILLLGRTALAADAVKMPGGNSMDSAVRIDPTYFTTALQSEYVKADGWYVITAPTSGTLTIRAKTSKDSVWFDLKIKMARILKPRNFQIQGGTLYRLPAIKEMYYIYTSTQLDAGMNGI